jgi:carbon storage regulator CsrA
VLVLTMRKGQKVHLGKGINITINEVKGSCVRLGIMAPNDVSIARLDANGVPVAKKADNKIQ